MKPRWSRRLTWEIAGRDKRGWIIIRSTNSAVFYSRYGVVIIKKGALSDGASVPRVLWPIISPLDSDIGNAPWPHDVIYADPDTKFTRKQADLIFRDALKADGAPRWKQLVAYAGVRIGGWLAWRDKKAHTITITHPETP